MSIRRIVGVTALVAGLGALAGAVGGMLVAIGFVLFTAGPSELRFLGAAGGTGAVIGAGVGIVVGPLLSWTLLRNVPIWRAIGELALAAGMATSLALALGRRTDMMLLWAAAGSLLAALRLRWSFSRRSKASTPPVEQ